MSVILSHLDSRRPLVVFDLESTGLDPATARVIEMAWLLIPPGGAARPDAVRLDPGVPIPPEATAVHGLRDRDVAGCPSFADVAPALAGIFAGADLAGFGVRRFDVPLLAAEFERAGHPFEVRGRAVLDAATIFHDEERRDLSAAVRFYLGGDHPGAHRAADDARAAAEVLDAQLARYPHLPREAWELHRRYAPVDAAGCFGVTDGRAIFNFGKYKGWALAAVAAQDPQYLEWLLRQRFLDDTRAVIESALSSPRGPGGYCGTGTWL